MNLTITLTIKVSIIFCCFEILHWNIFHTSSKAYFKTLNMEILRKKLSALSHTVAIVLDVLQGFVWRHLFIIYHDAYPCMEISKHLIQLILQPGSCCFSMYRIFNYLLRKNHSYLRKQNFVWNYETKKQPFSNIVEINYFKKVETRHICLKCRQIFWKKVKQEFRLVQFS